MRIIAPNNGFGNDSHTVLYLPFNGTNGSTTIPDKSISNHGNASVYGTAQLSTATKKYGSAALLLDGDSDYITYPDSADWHFVSSLTNSVSIDLWAKQAVTTGFHTYLFHCKSSNKGHYQWHFMNLYGYNIGVRFYAYDVSMDPHTFVDIYSVTEISDTNWHHILLIRVADEWGLYIDGIQYDYYLQTATSDAFDDVLHIGNFDEGTPTHFMNGSLDALRITYSNPFNAKPNSGNTDRILVPNREY